MKKAKQENYERGNGSSVLFFGYNNMPKRGIKNCKGYKGIKNIQKFKHKYLSAKTNKRKGSGKKPLEYPIELILSVKGANCQ